MTEQQIKIQAARDVLAKWRKDASEGIWTLSWEWSTFTSQKVIRDNGYIGDTDQPYDARLIVGTAGNPDLLDAIDGFLSVAAAAKGVNAFAAGFVVDAERIAAAIIAADERMSA